MDNRIDRLASLIENGHSQHTRRAAAKELGQFQKQQPTELFAVLTKLRILLHSTTWDTRIAAGYACGEVIKQLPAWPPSQGVIVESAAASATTTNGVFLDMKKFDLERLITCGVQLTGSEGSQYECQEDQNQQQSNVGSVNGLSDTTNHPLLGLNLTDLINEDDLKNHWTSAAAPTAAKNTPRKLSVKDVVEDCIRLAGGTKSLKYLDVKEPPPKKRIKRENTTDMVDMSSSSSSSFEEGKSEKNVLNESGDWNSQVMRWPLEEFVDSLLMDLFHPCWELRHGAAIGLREIFTYCGSGAGKCVNTSPSNMHRGHVEYLHDALLRTLSVIICDQFGDYIGDHVVAPVRESCAQLFASLVQLLLAAETADCRGKVANDLTRLLSVAAKQTRWEVRHGAAVAVKYATALCKEKLLDSGLVTLAMDLLSDPVDDVSAVAATILRSLASDLFCQGKNELIPLPELLAKVWQLLDGDGDDRDDWSTATAAPQSLMHLLAELVRLGGEHASVATTIRVETMLPRLYPFLSHPSTSVRKSCLLTLTKLVILANDNGSGWTVDLLQTTLRLLFVRTVVESSSHLLSLFSDAWQQVIRRVPLEMLMAAACPHFGEWMCLVMQSDRVPLETRFITHLPSVAMTSDHICSLYIGGGGGNSSSSIDLVAEHSTLVRTTSAQMLGELSHCLLSTNDESTISYYSNVLLTHLNTKSYIQRFVVGLVLTELNKRRTQPLVASELFKRVLECCAENPYFDEMTPQLTRIFGDVRELFVKWQQLQLPELSEMPKSVEEISATLCDRWRRDIDNETSLSSDVKTELMERIRNVAAAAEIFRAQHNAYSVACQAALASSVIYHQLPDKLSPIIRPLMDAARFEVDRELQQRSARHLAELLWLSAANTSSPNAKIVANLRALISALFPFPPANNTDIITLLVQQKSVQNDLPHHYQQQQQQQDFKWTGKALKNCRLPTTPDIYINNAFTPSSSSSSSLSKVEGVKKQGIGVKLCLIEACKRFGANLPNLLQPLWEILMPHSPSNDPPNLISSLQVLEVVIPVLPRELLDKIVTERLTALISYLNFNNPRIRHLAAKCLASFTQYSPNRQQCFTRIIKAVTSMLKSDQVYSRLGAIETVYCFIEALQLHIVPFIAILLVPALGRMSDADANVRNLASLCFAQLVQLLPLEGSGGGVENCKIEIDELREHVCKEKAFLTQLLDPSTIPDFQLPLHVNAQLRPYQQSGVNWLWFLNQYNLHGILSDEMGLGKTLQTLCVVAAEHALLQPAGGGLSLVICPSTLTSHWLDEFDRFFPCPYSSTTSTTMTTYLPPLRAILYAGVPAERERIRKSLMDTRHQNTVVIASYEIVRKDMDCFFGQMMWRYCVLDEGHVIRNGKTKLARAMKRVQAQHRLLLTGTPIQNGVLELWSLFDFLMPGFLGSMRWFNAHFAKPIIDGAEPKATYKQIQYGEEALQRLHRQVLPFVLRRTKRDVLRELPELVIQDLPCELTNLQRILYEHFTSTDAARQIDPSIVSVASSSSSATTTTTTTNTNTNTTTTTTTTAFQALTYLQNVCNHPRLVVTRSHPRYEHVMRYLHESGLALDDLTHSCKLMALKQLLTDCGIGVEPQTTTARTTATTASAAAAAAQTQHRALIFCQRRSMLDEIERLLRTPPFAEYARFLRIDGSVPASARHALAQRFNRDASIHLLLLTTQVGGFGLNLTGADTVIFVEHSWNPQRDAQAMARAHRIGQRCSVHCYRLITMRTLEQRIIGLQQFKLRTADTVINQDNRMQATMNMHQMLDLFSIQTERVTQMQNLRSSTDDDISLNEQQLDQYEEEYDLDTFIQNHLHAQQ